MILSKSAVAGGGIMNSAAKTDTPRVDQFFMAEESRFDRWRNLLQASRLWERSFAPHDSNVAQHQTAVNKIFQELRQWEDFFAYPGQKLLASLEDRISSGDATGAARTSQSIGNALLTRSYRSSVGD